MAERRRILLGVTGSIAAFKAAALVSELVRRGVEVKVVMTEAAVNFVGPLTFRSLSGNPVYRDMFAEQAADAWDPGHLSLARWADLVLVCPATAGVIARVAAALADDLLSAIILATGRPVIFVPAMNTGMWRNPLLQRRVTELKAAGYRILGPASGRLACGDEGEGRMVEVAEIIDFLRENRYLPGGA